MESKEKVETAPETPDAKEQQTDTAPAAPEEKDAAEKKAKKAKKEKADAAALMNELEQTKKALADQQELYQRLCAEYANYKRRTEQEKEQLGLFTKCELLKELLPVLDNFERAVDAPAGDEYKAGIDMIIKQLQKQLADMGLESIEAENAAFDPEVHNAVMREDADGVDPETVTQVFQKGYKMGGRVLRPAMVKVAN